MDHVLTVGRCVFAGLMKAADVQTHTPTLQIALKARNL
jgi:hypothetical protein